MGEGQYLRLMSEILNLKSEITSPPPTPRCTRRCDRRRRYCCRREFEGLHHRRHQLSAHRKLCNGFPDPECLRRLPGFASAVDPADHDAKLFDFGHGSRRVCCQARSLRRSGSTIAVLDVSRRDRQRGGIRRRRRYWIECLCHGFNLIYGFCSSQRHYRVPGYEQRWDRRLPRQVRDTMHRHILHHHSSTTDLLLVSRWNGDRRRSWHFRG